MNDLISVIVPVYKVEKYLNRCVGSILEQTYRKLEIILIDDGSPDRCGEMCDEFTKLDSRVVVIHKKNGGLSSARNAGIEIAKGKYITFLDSDDWVRKEYVEKLYKLLITTESDIAVCNFIKLPSGGDMEKASPTEIHEFTGTEALQQLTGEYCIQLVVSWGKIYHKCLFEQIRFPFGKFHEDEFVAHYLLYGARKVVYTTEQLLYYWQREDSITGMGFDSKKRIDAAEAFVDRARFFDDVGLVELRDKTYMAMFDIYRKIIENNDDGRGNYYKKEAIVELKRIRVELRKGNYRIRFKIFVELYCLAPTIMKWVSQVYRKLRDPQMDFGLKIQT